MVLTANFLYAIYLPNSIGHKPNRLGGFRVPKSINRLGVISNFDGVVSKNSCSWT